MGNRGSQQPFSQPKIGPRISLRKALVTPRRGIDINMLKGLLKSCTFCSSIQSDNANIIAHCRSHTAFFVCSLPIHPFSCISPRFSCYYHVPIAQLPLFYEAFAPCFPSTAFFHLVSYLYLICIVPFFDAARES